MQSPFSVLGLPDSATESQLKNRYRHFSLLIHPDKQSANNYELAKQYFQRIDSAYRSIATPLRRYLYRQFGMSAIKLYDERPLDFSEFNGTDINFADRESTAELRQQVIYLLYEEQAGMEGDSSRYSMRVQHNMTKSLPLKYRTKPVEHLEFPLVEKLNLGYEGSLGKYSDIGLTYSIQQKAKINDTSPTPLTYSLNAVGRIYGNLLAQTTVSFSQEELNGSFGLVSQTNLGQISMNLFTYESSTLYFQPRLDMRTLIEQKNLSVSLKLEPGQRNIQLVHQKQGSRWQQTIKFVTDGSGSIVAPRLQYELNQRIKLFAQLQIAATARQGVNVYFALQYGYRITLNEEFKLEVADYLGYHNFVQISLISRRGRLQIPLTAVGYVPEVQLYKSGLILGLFVLYALYERAMRRSRRIRAQTFRQQQQRLVEGKNQALKLNASHQSHVRDNLYKQLRLNGLIIVRALLVSPSVAKTIYRMIDVKDFEHIQSQQSLAMCQLRFDRTINIDYYQPESQTHDLTAYVQSRADGSAIDQLEIPKINPCIDEGQQPVLVVVYSLNGVFCIKSVKSGQKLTIGETGREKKSALQRITDWLTDKFLWQ